MKRSVFLLIAAIGSFGFGAMMFFVPSAAANLLGLELSLSSESLIHGMGGLIIGTGVMNLLFRNVTDTGTVRALLLTNIITHLFGIAADIWGVFDGALLTSKIAPVELTHLFIGVGSLIYLLKLPKATEKQN